jgi:hypothetical protein
MMRRNRRCGPCDHIRAHVSFYLPWGLLLGGGIASFLSLSPVWNKGAAYLVAASLLWFALSILARLGRRFASSHLH